MGVPGFFAWLLKNYKNHVLTTDNPKIDYLFLDFNCLMHPMCFKVLEENLNWKNKDSLEDAMIKKIIEYLDHIVEFVQPKKCIYIAIDGVCPMTKVKHQRLRRFKSVADTKYITELKNQYNIPVANYWSNASITPGTEFMKKITDALSEHCKQNLKKLTKKVIFSSAQTPGEGEHKIMNFIKRRRIGTNTTVAVYGLDADLIFLSMATGKSNMYLLREYKEVNKGISEFPFIWVNVDKLKDCVVDVFKVHEVDTSNLNNDELVRDFIFLCYLLGNDFLPQLPNLNIHDGGIDTLISVYKDAISGSPLVNFHSKSDISIDTEFLTRILHILSLKEKSYFYSQYKKRQNFLPRTENDFESKLWNYENIRYQFNDPVKLGSDNPREWKPRYYQHYFEMNEKFMIFNACQRYVEGLHWVAHYYFGECVSWHWLYPYPVAPFVSDLHHFMATGKLRKVEFKLNKPIQPISQLLIVIPPQLKHLLPPAYQSLLTTRLKEYSPETFDIDRLNKKKNYEAVPLLKPINLNIIQTLTKEMDKFVHDKNKEPDLTYLKTINVSQPDLTF